VPTPEDIRARYDRLRQLIPGCGWRGCHRPRTLLIEIGDPEKPGHRQVASCKLHNDAWAAYAQERGLPIVQTEVDAPEPGQPQQPRQPQPVQPRPPAYEQQTLI
jgi:hypothetical protein